MRWLSLLLSLWLVGALAKEEILRLATTTSTENSGLLKLINRAFYKKTGIRVQVVAVGSGAALRLARNGDVDLVLVHAPMAEERFVAYGYGINRLPVMHNDFVIVGPTDDPAGVRRAKTALEAFRSIAAHKAIFLSRGDESGTHNKEKLLWARAGIEPRGEWYLSVGQGMAATLRMAMEKRGYTLTDRGTYLALQEKLSGLEILFEGDPKLYNPYHVIVTNPRRHPEIQYDLAMRYVAFLTGPEGQELIRQFRIGGKPLFYPDVLE